jgi:glycosyltransferase involved in cell wall biosynthesis
MDWADGHQNGGGAPGGNDRSLTVAYVLKMFPRFSETFILREILELERRGVRVVTFSMKPPNELQRQPGTTRISGPGWTIPPLRGTGLLVHLGCHLRTMMRYPRKYLDALAFVYQRGTRAAWTKFGVAPFIVCRARAAGVEHIHAHFASGPARQAKLASLLSGIPFSFTAHAKDLFWNGHNHGKNNKLKKRIRLASFVVAISEYNRRFMEGLNFKVPRRKVVTVYNGLDLQDWPFSRPDGQPAARQAGDPPLILAVGRLVPKKGFHILVEACRLLRDEGVPFRCEVVGEGPAEMRLRGLIQQYELEELVALPGAIAQDQLRENQFARAAVLVQPSVVDSDGDQDGIPTVLLEAMAVGLPVLTTPVSGIGESVVDGETGLMVTPNDPPALAAAARRVLRDPALAAHLTAGGRRLIERRFSLRNNAKVLIHLMRQAARGGERWSEHKLREKMGLDPLPSTARGAVSHGLAIDR